MITLIFYIVYSKTFYGNDLPLNEIKLGRDTWGSIMKNIVVIGSLNLDVVEKIDSLPLQGATVRVTGRENNLGGKGANQAVAAARQGVHVSFIGGRSGMMQLGRCFAKH